MSEKVLTQRAVCLRISTVSNVGGVGLFRYANGTSCEQLFRTSCSVLRSQDFRVPQARLTDVLPNTKYLLAQIHVPGAGLEPA